MHRITLAPTTLPDTPPLEFIQATGLKGKVAYDATKYIDAAINEVLKTLTETLLIVAIVIYLFLGSLRSVLVPLVSRLASSAKSRWPQLARVSRTKWRA